FEELLERAGRHHEARRHGDTRLRQLAQRTAFAAHRGPVGNADILEPGNRGHGSRGHKRASTSSARADLVLKLKLARPEPVEGHINTVVIITPLPAPALRSAL